MTDRQLDALLTPLLPKLVALRRDLHRHPELAYEEHRTAEVITEFLTDLGLEPRRAAGTGVVVDLGHGPAVALRADIDALALEEKNTFEHRSRTPGVMHACGHDGHTAILLGTAAALAAAEQGRGAVRLLFQPAEEGGAGAARMIDEGVLDGVEQIFGLHNWPVQPFGTVGVRVGTVMAASAQFDVTVHGQGGHGSQPQNTRDPVVVAASLVTQLQALVSRETDPRCPAVLSVCTVQGGTAKNIIPDEVRLGGTARALDDETIDRLGARLTEVAEAVACVWGCRAEVSFQRQYPALINHQRPAELVFEVAEEVLGPGSATDEELPAMGAEDFSFYLREVPGAFFFLGSARPGAAPKMIHKSRYDFDDDLLSPGIRLFLGLIESVLGWKITNS